MSSCLRRLFASSVADAFCSGLASRQAPCVADVEEVRPALPHKHRKAARAIAAVFYFAAIVIKNAVFKIGVGGIGCFYNQYLIAAHTKMAVGQLARSLWGNGDALAYGIDHYKVVA